MNSPKLAIERLEEIARAASRDLPLAERCGLYSAARFLIGDLRAHAHSDAGGIDAYLSEKLMKSLWHIAAMLGFDVDNGHDDSAHRSWAYGQISTVSDIFHERFSED